MIYIKDKPRPTTTIWLWFHNSLEDRVEALLLGKPLDEFTVVNKTLAYIDQATSILSGGPIKTLTIELVNQHKLYLYFDIHKIPVHLLKSGAVYLSTYDPRRESTEQG